MTRLVNMFFDVADLTQRMRTESSQRPATGAEYAIFAGMVSAIAGGKGPWGTLTDADRIAAINDALRALDDATSR